MKAPILLIALSLAGAAHASNGRYLTWIDDQGRVHNTFVDSRYSEQQRQAAKRIVQSDQARLRDTDGTQWPGSAKAGESKRRYFTWVDASGNLQNSFYAGGQVPSGERQFVLPNGQNSSEYIDSDVLQGRGYSRPEQGAAYFTWVDEQGRTHNSPVPARGKQEPGEEAPGPIAYTESREMEFKRKAAQLPSLDGQPTAAMKALLEGSEEPVEALYQNLVDQCCGQLPDDAFTEVSAAEPRYEELNKLSPSFEFPMGRSYYSALKLPRSQHSYGLRIRSFANQQVVYPSLLFLDEAKRPTRLVSDAVYQLHGETWYRYAYIEGTVQVRANQGERYVLLLTTDEDRSLHTLDNKPYKRPLQDLALSDAGMQVHEHSDQGSFELAIVK
ncbi:MalM family protein [Pseudomonas sp. LFM046]|uniref:MalM family protein n=1 Tax=Pseudomonas sp. LFM046 TaxID=1608357 RepID=UPI0005CFB4D0|nr:MalM family protein [Pseudomonas sp. LFM046]